MNKQKQVDAVVDHIWKVHSLVAEYEGSENHAAIVVKLPRTPRQQAKVFEVAFPTQEEAPTENAAKRIWQARCEALIQRQKADLLILVNEAYLPPRGMEQEALALQLAGGRVRDMPNHIEALTMIAETKWGKVRMIWQQILDCRMVGDVVDTDWQPAEAVGGLFSGFFKKDKSTKRRINP